MTVIRMLGKSWSEKSLGCQGAGGMPRQKARILVLERSLDGKIPWGIWANHGAFNQNA